MFAAVSASDDRRSRDRLEVDRKAVLRFGDRVQDIELEDLTSGGCRFTCATQLPLFVPVSIGIAAIGPTPAQIAWQSGTSYGCAFDRPLPDGAVLPTAPDNVARIAEAAPFWRVGTEIEADIEAEIARGDPVIAMLPLRTRVAVISGLSALLWSGIVGLVRLAL